MTEVTVVALFCAFAIIAQTAVVWMVMSKETELNARLGGIFASYLGLDYRTPSQGTEDLINTREQAEEEIGFQVGALLRVVGNKAPEQSIVINAISHSIGNTRHKTTSVSSNGITTFAFEDFVEAQKALGEVMIEAKREGVLELSEKDYLELTGDLSVELIDMRES